MRRSSIIKPRDKPKIRSSSVGGIYGVRSSDIPFGTKITPENEGVLLCYFCLICLLAHF